MKLNKILSIMTLASMALGSAEAAPLKSGINMGDLDQGTPAAQDFYQYATGGWQKAHPLPAAYSRYGTFEVLGENNSKRMDALFKELQSGTFQPGTMEWKLATLYNMAMDSVRRSADGTKPLQPILKKLEAAKTVKALKAIQHELAPTGSTAFYRQSFESDEKNSKMMALHVAQGGLTLGQKEYYLDEDTATTDVREAYKKHIVRMFQLFGFSEKAAKAKMQNVMKTETALAKVSRTKAELRDIKNNYNKMTLAKFGELYPALGLEALMNATGVDSKLIEDIIVGQPEFMEGANKVVAALTADEYRDNLEWNQIVQAANYLSDDIAAANFEFFGKKLTGAKEMHPLWKRVNAQIELQMGQAMGKMYVDHYFPASSKERMEKLVKNLQTALGERIMAQSWMSDSTKKVAMEKLGTFYVKIGYPKEWIDMTALQIDPAKSYYDNIIACCRFWTAWDIDHHAGKPTDRDEWYMYPQTVNAYYNPPTNEICFPAGILQPPFFDADADDAFNYGAIGVVIGHEMTHGFDDEGRNFDKDGNMHDWWQPEDVRKFEERADLCEKFFSGIKVLPDLNANGKLTLGENMADHGGLQVAYLALQNATKDAPLPVVDGLTPAQRFFIAYAGVWANTIAEAEIRRRTKSDPHSLGEWRVNGALPHIDAWYDAFGVKEGDKMFIPKKDRLDLW